MDINPAASSPQPIDNRLRRRQMIRTNREMQNDLILCDFSFDRRGVGVVICREEEVQTGILGSECAFVRSVPEKDRDAAFPVRVCSQQGVQDVAADVAALKSH
jgi:hypothetical protein